jgi:hypothetical protein
MADPENTQPAVDSRPTPEETGAHIPENTPATHEDPAAVPAGHPKHSRELEPNVAPADQVTQAPGVGPIPNAPGNPDEPLRREDREAIPGTDVGGLEDNGATVDGNDNLDQERREDVLEEDARREREGEPEDPTAPAAADRQV